MVFFPIGLCSMKEMQIGTHTLESSFALFSKAKDVRILHPDSSITRHRTRHCLRCV